MIDACDALVIGGGPAGATAAALLARGGWSVLAVESKTFPRRKVCGEYLSATNLPLLRELGVGERFEELAGPPVKETAIFVGGSSARAALPRLGPSDVWGRALGREKLDLLLLRTAAQQGATVLQPARCTAVTPTGDGFSVELHEDNATATRQVQATIVILAHGSWDRGELPSQHRRGPRPTDLLGFKAHFRQTALAAGLMPLISFADGYGGMVHGENGLTSLSCCIRRRRLERLPRSGGASAGEGVFNYILDSSPVLRPVFADAELVGPWLAAGPLQTGYHACYQKGLFLIGNAAGEAHPVVAEGISMAMQSAWLLAQRLMSNRNDIAQKPVRDRIGRSYTVAWKKHFLPRLRMAAAVASWAERPLLVAAALPWLRNWPGLLTWGASLSGKNCPVVACP